MALQAEQVDVAQFQHVRIWPAVRQMARLASIDLYGLVLENKRPLLVRVALEADRVLCGGSPHLFGAHRAVHVMAIAALHQPFIYPVMEWHVELRFLLEMAGVAKLGLRLDEQELRLLRVVGRMAGDATHIILRMLRVDGIHVLRAASMAVEAPRVDLLCGSHLEFENLGLVSSAVDVGLPRTVATLASLPRRAFLRIQRGHKVWGILKMLEEILGWHICVAGLAGLGAYIERGIRRARISLLIRLFGGGLFLGLSAKRDHGSHKKEHLTDENSYSGLLPVNTHHHPSVCTPPALDLGSSKTSARLIPSL